MVMIKTTIPQNVNVITNAFLTLCGLKKVITKQRYRKKEQSTKAATYKKEVPIKLRTNAK